MDCLIGYDTYIGSYIRESLDPNKTEYYNEDNFHELNSSVNYSRVYICCIPDCKWKANRNPHYDEKTLMNIFNVIKNITCDKIILISTIDVHDHSLIQGEIVKKKSNESFGFNRANLEENMRSIYDKKLLIVRLPETFGIGIKDNILCDFMNKTNIHKINMNSCFQWYPVFWLFQDINTALSYDIETINLYTEPIETSEIICEIFPEFKNKCNYGRRIHIKHISMYDNLYISSKNSILLLMKEFVRMHKYISKPNMMSVSNMAWETWNDKHAIFLMKRYGISNVEIIPTKYSTWQDIFQNPTFHQEFIRNGISIHALQSVLYGINGDFINNQSEIIEHMDKVMLLCEKIRAKVVVIGAADKRNAQSGISVLQSENIISNVLNSIKNNDIKICLQPVSKDYGCTIGNNIESCNRIIKDKSLFMNFDTGNYIMERDEPFYFNKKSIGHCHLSCSFLRPIHNLTYERFKKQDLRECFSKFPDGTKISLEMRCNDICNLGEHFRRFSTFVSGI